MTLRDIKEVKDIIISSEAGTDEVNRYLKDGWILIDTSKPNPFTVICHIGRV